MGRALTAALAVGLVTAACAGFSGATERSSGVSTAAPQIVFTGPTFPASSSGEQELFTSRLDGSGLTQITNDGAIKFLPHFSPDGTRVLYTKYLSGGYGTPGAITAIAVYELSTRRETLLTNNGVAFQAAWSPDGTQIAYGSQSGNGLWVMNADGSGAKMIGQPGGSPSDLVWHDPAWSSDNWIYFVVLQNVNDCVKVRIDRIRPNGANRTQITAGGPSCTPAGFNEPTGDADPGISPDGKTLYSSRGLPVHVPGIPGATLRHLYTFSSAPYYSGKPETDLSGAMEPNCGVGVPKISPGGAELLVSFMCADDMAHAGVDIVNLTGTRWTFVEHGFGADWNPAYRSP